MDILNQDYVCLNAAGYEYLRKARTVGELPWSMRAEAQNLISKVIGLKVLFGVPLYVSNGMTKTLAKADKREYLMFKGCDLPLKLLEH